MTCSRKNLLLCFLLLSGSGCSFDEPGHRSKQQLRAAGCAYEAGNYRLTVECAETLLRERAAGDEAVEAYYLRGMARYRQGRLDQARSDLARVALEAADDKLQARARCALGELDYQQGDYKLALRNFELAVRLISPGEKPADHADFRMGCILQRQGKWHEADLHFQRVMCRFSGTQLARHGRRRTRGRKWTIQLGVYKSRQNALLAREKLAFNKEIKVLIEPIMRDSQLGFALQAGRWNEYQKAQASLPEVKAIKPDAFIYVTR